MMLRLKRATDYEKIFANHVSDKELSNPIRKQTKTDRQKKMYTVNQSQMANRHMKQGLILLVIT